MQESLKELREIWYAKLRESGFKDVEDQDNPDLPLKRNADFEGRPFTQSKIQKIELTREYYIKAMELTATYSFDNPTHKTIWELHCEGYSRRKIEKEISNHIPTYLQAQIGNIIGLIASEIL